VARSEKEDDYIQPSQHGFRAHRGTDTALSHLVNAMEQAKQMDTTIGISSFDIRWAFDSVSKGLIHMGWVRLGVQEDVVRWLQAMDEEALTIVRTPFALEIHNTAGLDGLWKAIREGKDLCEDAMLERIREAAGIWGKWSNGICMRQRSRTHCLERTVTILQATSFYIKDYKNVNKCCTVSREKACGWRWEGIIRVGRSAERRESSKMLSTQFLRRPE
jgi:hypothetical protein